MLGFEQKWQEFVVFGILRMNVCCLLRLVDKRGAEKTQIQVLFCFLSLYRPKVEAVYQKMSVSTLKKSIFDALLLN